MKMIKFFSMAALALAMTACSNSDDFSVQQPVQNASGKVQFTATIAAPTDGGMRTVYTEEAGAIKVEWKEGDEIAVLNSNDHKRDVVTVKSVNADGSAVIEGEITSPSESGIKVNLFYPASLVNANGSMDFSVYTGGTLDGTLASIAANADFRYAANCALDTSGDNVTLKDQVTLESQIAIWKLTLQDGSSNSINATALTVQYGSRSTKVTPASATDVLYVPVIIVSGTDVTITATTASGDYTYSKSGLTLAKGTYYESTVTMAAAAGSNVDLSTLSANYKAKNGDVLTGTLASNVKISIADGATVTLKDTNINGSGTLTDGDYAGLTPEGDAIIILEGSNTVKGFKENYPGIFAAVGKTLTIQGTGSLNTSGNGRAAGIGACGWGGNCGNIEIAGGTVTAVGGQYAAGIGSGPWTSCGTITITGGTVNATGGGTSMDGTGIGAGNGGSTAGTDQSSCGDISITGGTVTATGNGNGAGIGGSWNSKCGTITIGSGVISVTATKGSSCPNSIGAGTSGSCGTVSIATGANVTQN